MKQVNHELLQYSSKESGGQRAFNYIITFFMVAFSLIMLGFGLYYWANLDIPDSGFLAAVLIPLSIIILVCAFAAIYVTNHHQRYERRFELSEEGIFEEKVYPKRNKREESHIRFQDIHKMIIGNYVEYVYVYGKQRDFSHYNFGALLIVMHKDGLFFRTTFDQEDLELWTSRFMDKKVPVFYTEYNLLQTFVDHLSYQIDFNEIAAASWDGLKEPPSIGHSDKKNPYIDWEPENIKVLKERDKLRKTKKAEKSVCMILFFYAIFIGGIIFAQLPVDKDGAPVLTDLFFALGVLVNIFIPIVGVYWRSYTKWYMPFAYFIVVTAGNTLGLFTVSMILGNPILTMFGNMIALITVILFLGWLPALLIVKGIKFLFFR